MPYTFIGGDVVTQTLPAVTPPITFTPNPVGVSGCQAGDAVVLGFWIYLDSGCCADLVDPVFSLAHTPFAPPAAGEICSYPPFSLAATGGSCTLSASGDLSVSFPNIPISQVLIQEPPPYAVKFVTAVAVYRNFKYVLPAGYVGDGFSGWDLPTWSLPDQTIGPLTVDPLAGVAIALVSPDATTPAGWTARNSQIADIDTLPLPTGYTLSDSTGPNYVFYYQLIGGSGALAIACPAFPVGTVGTPYSGALIGSGGMPPYTYAITSGSLPDGLTLDASTGEITGTPTTPGIFSFTAQITDSVPNTATADCSMYIGTLDITCPTDAAAVDVPYSSSITVSGGTPPFDFAVEGTLPPGLSLDSGTGAITGTPTTPGTYPFIAAVVDADDNFGAALCSITIAGSSLAITCGSPPKGYVGSPYFYQFPITGGVGPFTFSIIAGILPSGLVLDASTGAVSGTPVGPGNYSFTIQVEDSTTTIVSASCEIDIGVFSPLVITLRGVKRRRACSK